jgi:hypothetical protein
MLPNISLNTEQRGNRLNRFIETDNLPTIPNKAIDFHKLAEVIKLQSACIRTKFAMIKKWQALSLTPFADWTVEENKFDMNMRRWCQTFNPVDSAIDDFRGDAGLMLIEEEDTLNTSAKKAMLNINNIKRKRELDENAAYTCPIPIRPKLNHANEANEANEVEDVRCKYICANAKGVLQTSNTCKTPPPMKPNRVNDEAYATPEERARRIILNAKT